MFGRFRIIDLSISLEHNAASEPMPARIHYVPHADEGLQQMQRFLGVKAEDLSVSNGLSWAVEEIQAITHLDFRRFIWTEDPSVLSIRRGEPDGSLLAVPGQTDANEPVITFYNMPKGRSKPLLAP